MNKRVARKVRRQMQQRPPASVAARSPAPTLNDAVQVLRVIHSAATHRAKRSTGEGYTYEQGRIDAVNEIMEALGVR